MSSTATFGESSIPAAPGGLPILGHGLALLREPWTFLTSLPTLGSDLVRIRLGPFSAVVVCDPDLTRQLLRADKVFDKGGPLFDVARTVVGNNVITAPHSTHRPQRRQIQTYFSTSRMPKYAEVMSAEIDAVTAHWTAHRAIDVVPEMQQLTTRCFLAAMFSVSLTSTAMAQALADVSALVDGLYRQLVLPPWLRWLPTPSNLRYRAASSSLRSLVDQIIRQRRQSDIDADDLLSILLATRDCAVEAPRPADTTAIFDQFMAFFIAGSETTASALSWALYLLASHPDILAEAQAEVDRVIPDRLAHRRHVSELDLTRRVLAETLRLYPPGWLFTRVVTADSSLGKYLLPQGTSVIYSPYLLHHLDSEYTDPQRFEPDRWRSQPTPSSYLPFGAGPRRCAGEEFALTEATLALATIVRRWHLTPSSDEPIYPAVAMALRPKRFRIKVTERSTRTSELRTTML